jgi:ketosteroid isomerase-like protein
MKKTSITLSFLLLFMCLYNACQPQVDIEAAKKAIIAINEEERDAFFAKDITRLADIWLQDSGSKRYFTSENSLTILDGWTEIKADYQEDFESDWWENYENVKADFSNYEIQVFNNSALVYHDITWSGKYLGEEFENLQKRVIYLLKKDETWKISFIAQLTVPVKEQDVEKETAEENQ